MEDLPPLSPSEPGEAPGTGRTWSSRRPGPHSISVKGRLSGTSWLKEDKEHLHQRLVIASL